MRSTIGPELPDRVEALPDRPVRLIAETPREFLRLNDDAVLGLVLLGLLALVVLALAVTGDPAGASASSLGVAFLAWTLLVALALRGLFQGVFVSRDGVLIRGVVSSRQLAWDGLDVRVGPNPYGKADRSEWLLFSSPAARDRPIGGPGWRRTPGQVDARGWRFEEVADGLQRLATSG